MSASACLTPLGLAACVWLWVVVPTAVLMEVRKGVFLFLWDEKRKYNECLLPRILKGKNIFMK